MRASKLDVTPGNNGPDPRGSPVSHISSLAAANDVGHPVSQDCLYPLSEPRIDLPLSRKSFGSWFKIKKLKGQEAASGKSQERKVNHSSPIDILPPCWFPCPCPESNTCLYVASPLQLARFPNPMPSHGCPLAQESQADLQLTEFSTGCRMLTSWI